MTDKTVLITGCSSGIGLACARSLHARGYRVFAAARAEQDVLSLRDDGLRSVQLDLSDKDSIHAALESVLSASGGRLFALINNGAYGQPGAVEDLATDVLRRQLETNLFGTHELTRLVIPVMRSQGHGRIVQVSSILGLVCLPYRGAYNASKYALEALSDTLRLELTGSGIHVALVEPGPITSRFRANAYAAFREHIDTSNSVHRTAYAKEVQRLQSDTPVPYTLPEAAVVDKIIHALESRRPKVRYLVTKPAHVFYLLKRFLPARWTDRMLLAVAGIRSAE
jgi:NAD(P)-dependent dehydrogenase (short-subunit alcohol dehydrogenase family)